MCLFALVLCCLTACSESGQTEGKHVWEDQVNTIERAEAVEGIIQESVDLQRQQIDRATE